jgi:FAD/FMN-containing dehydrogenase
MSTLQMTTSTGAETALPEAALHDLKATVRGAVIRRDEADYEEARGVWNGMIDKHPALIIRCVGRDDVLAAVNFARIHHLLVAVRGGGHNVNGNATCDGGLVIDLSPMKAIQVDQEAYRVRAQAGVTWGELDRQTQAFGLAVPGGVVSTTGIAGLTLGGGLGWLRRKHGLSCDNLVLVEVVTAEGQCLKASATEHADLFWGIRGGGGNFGIITSFEYRLHPVGPEVMFCAVFYPAALTKEALRFYRGYTQTAPDELSSFAVSGTIPTHEAFPRQVHGAPFILFAACYAGPIEEGARVVQPLREWSTPLVDLSGPTSYLTVQSFFDADYPRGALQYYWKSLFLSELHEVAIDEIERSVAARPSSRSTLDIWHLGGALSRASASESAIGKRDAPYLLAIEANWEDPKEAERNIAWTRQAYEGIVPYSTGHSYLNLNVLGEGSVRAAFRDNHERLVALKKKYDPNNLFHLNQNIPPAG